MLVSVRRCLRNAAVAAVISAGSGGLAQAGIFSAPQVISGSAGNALSVADVDQDGKVDVIFCSTTAGTVSWAHNNGNGTFANPQLVSSNAGAATCVAAADLDRDGRLDIVTAAGTEIAWYRNNGGGTFASKQILAASAGAVSALVLSDLDRDGRLDLVFASANAGAIRSCQGNGDGTFNAAQTISSTAAGVAAILVADINRDGAPDVVFATTAGTVAWLANNGTGAFVGAQQNISTSFSGASALATSDLNSDGSLDVVVTGGGVIAWFANNGAGAFGAQESVAASVTGVTCLSAIDVTGDGRPDVVCASSSDNSVSWFANSGTGIFGSRQVIANDAIGGGALFLADIDKDGDLDLVTASTLKVSWSKNKTAHRSASFPTRTVISNSAVGAYSACSADLDRDGKLDVISGSTDDPGGKVAWYRNLGDGTFNSGAVIDASAPGARYVCAADLNGDGWVDVLVACSLGNQVIWYRNNGGSSPTFTKFVITTNTLMPSSVAAGDIDRDGKLDVLFASTYSNTIGWARNNGDGTFTQQVVSTATNYPQSAHLADINGDGKLDVVSTSVNDHQVAWYENLGSGTAGQPPTFQKHAIVTTVGRLYDTAFPADLDNDGRMDVVSGALYSKTVEWNRSQATDQWGAQDLAGALGGGITSVSVSDLDRDGKPDVLIAAYTGNKIAWVRNRGGGQFDPVRIISSTVYEAESVSAGEFSGDGSIGVLSASFADNTIAFYPNVGGHFALASSSTAPASMLEGQKRSVFQLNLTHKGVAGDEDVALSKLTLLFEKSPGVPMSGQEAANIIRSVSICADSPNSGVFDANRDSVLFKQTAINLSGTTGRLIVDLSNAQAADFQASVGTAKTFFVVVELVSNASSQTPNTFRVTTVTAESGAVAGLGADSGGPLAAELAANVSTPFIAISANAAPVYTNAIPAVSVVDASKPVSVPLIGAFSDLEDATLTYTITGNTNPGILDFAGVDASNGLLVLNFHAGAKGASQITITATDSGGKSATATFTVAADLITTFTDWQGSFSGLAAQSDATANLLKYAFAMDSRTGRNGPALATQNGTRVFSHLKPKYATDLLYQYEISTDLVHWTPAVEGVHYFPFVSSLDDGTVSENLVLLVKWASAFVRARVQLVTPAAASTPAVTLIEPAIPTSGVNHAPTTSGIGNVVAFDTAKASSVPLFSSFDDYPGEDLPQQLSYSISANTNPSILASASIDPTNGLLKLTYAPGVHGATDLTVTARDSGGKTVSTTFTVTSIHDRADWTAYFGGSGTGAASLLDYGFATSSGFGSGNRPRIFQQSGMRIVSHLRPQFAGDITYHYEISSDLVQWTPAVRGVHYFEFGQDLDDGTRLVSHLLLVDWSRTFLRVNVTAP